MMRQMHSRYIMVLALGSLLIASVASNAGSSPGENIALTERHLIDLGNGRRLNLVCMGRGSPTVVFDYGWGSNLLHWQKIQPGASALTQACFYDRAGYGYSDPSPRPMTAQNATDDLHRLLSRAGIHKPVVLVGLSLGGLFATLYTDRFPSDVAGLVLIDPSFAGQPDVRSAADRKRGDLDWKGNQANLQKCADLARRGQLSERGPHGCFDLVPGRTRTEIKYLMEQFLKPFRYDAARSEAANHFSSGKMVSEDDAEEMRAARSFDDKPLIVLTAGKQERDPEMSQAEQKAFAQNWKAGHDKLAARSTRGQSIVVANAGHFIPADRPDTVVEAIRRVVNEVRGHQN